MTDSGFSGLPPGPRTGDASFPQSLIELKAKIIELRGELKVQRVRETLEGEIIRHNPDGTTRIRTDKGEITVELRGRELPPEGAKVQVEIPPGTPPRQVIVRPAPEAPPQPEPLPSTPQTAQPQRPQPQSPQAGPPPARPEPGTDAPPRVPVLIDVRTVEDLTRHLEALPKSEAVPVPLQPRDVIRLLPLPPQQVLELVRALPVLQQAQATKLPQQPQVTLPTALFEDLRPLLTLARVEPLLLLHDLPAHLPVYTQAAREPFSGFAFPPGAAPSVSAATQLIQHMLAANRPDANAPPFSPAAPAPFVIAPPAASAPETVSSRLPAPLLSSLPLVMPLQAGEKAAPVASFGLTQSFDAFLPGASFAAAPVTPFDVRIQTITPPQVRLVEVIAQARAEAGRPAPLHAAMLPLQVAGQAGSLTGEVTGITPQNLPVLSFFFPGVAEPQHFIMQFQTANLPQGAQVQIMPLPGAAALQAGAPAPFVPFEFFSSYGWPAMEELAQTLQQAAPQAAQALSNIAASAAAPARMPIAALFFIAAVRSGDISGWLGDKTVDTLRRIGKSDLLSRLSRDASGLQRTAAEPSGEWRASALPMMWDGQMHKMMLYYRHDGKNENDGEDSKRGTRFIFDLNLNRLGAVQLDGLHRAQGNGGRLDLIVRTKNALSGTMQQTMRRTYIEALEQSGLKGELSFQNKPGQFVKVEMPKRAAS